MALVVEIDPSLWRRFRGGAFWLPLSCFCFVINRLELEETENSSGGLLRSADVA